MTQQTLEIVLEVILIFLGFYLAFFKSYFSEKGKNIATKEDIGDITSIVEKIRADFIKETERIKIELQYSNQIKYSLKTEELRSIFDCYEKYFVWLNNILDCHFSSAESNIITVLENSYSSFQLAHAKFDLLIDNQPVSSHLDKMKIETLKLEGFCKVKFHEYKSTEYNIEGARKIIDISIRKAEIQKAYDRQMEFMREYQREKLAQYEELVKLNHVFRKFCYDLIIPLSDREDTIEKI